MSTCRFLDRDKVHPVQFEGATFSVTGPLITPRPPQGQLVVIGADTLGVTGLLDIALVAAPTRAELERRTDAARAAGAPVVFADLTGAGDDLSAERLDGLVDGVRLHLGAVAPAAAWPLREVLALPRPVNRYAAA